MILMIILINFVPSDYTHELIKKLELNKRLRDIFQKKKNRSFSAHNNMSNNNIRNYSISIIKKPDQMENKSVAVFENKFEKNEPVNS